MPPIKDFCFDVFGPVVDWRSCIARDAAIFFERHGLSRFDPLEFADAWRGRYQPAMQACRAGQRPYVRLDVLHRENLEYVLGEMGVGIRNIDESQLTWLNMAWHRLDPWHDVVAGLTRLISDRKRPRLDSRH